MNRSNPPLGVPRTENRSPNSLVVFDASASLLLPKDSTDVCVFEREGRYSELSRVLEARTENHSILERTQLARAYAFLGFEDKAQAILQELNPEKLDPQSHAIYCLTEARLARSHEDWPKALEIAKLAESHARQTLNTDLLAEAEFALAIAWVELGRFFLGIDIFQRLCENQKLSDYRRELARSNMALLLWDLGRQRDLKEATALTPRRFRERMQVMLWLLQVDQAAILSYLDSKAFKNELPAHKRHTAFYLSSAILVLRNQHPLIQAPRYLMDYLWSEKDHSPLSKLSYLFLNGDTPPPFLTANRSWRNEIKMQFIYAIGLAETSPLAARTLWYEQLNPLLAKLRLRMPLIPYLHESGFEPQSSWSQAIANHLRLSEQGSQQVVYALQGRHLKCSTQQGWLSVDLGQSPVSRRLIEILAGPRGHIITKREIHEQLTRSSYRSDLHDGRILKLLARLTHRLQQFGVLPPWEIPKDNTVRLIERLEVET